MKTHAKSNLFLISVSILLVAGIIVLSLLYRSNVDLQLTLQKDRLVYQLGYLQSQLFLTDLNDVLDTLSTYATRVAEVPAADRSGYLSAAAGETGHAAFLAIALVGADGQIPDASGNTAYVGGEPFFQDALSGKCRVQRYIRNGVVYFACAVPYADENGPGVLVGFLSEDEFTRLLGKGGGQLAFHSALFERNGNIVAGTSQIPALSGYRNVYTAFMELENKGVLDKGAAEALFRAVTSGADDAADCCIQRGDVCYTFHSIGINNWYTLNDVESDFTKNSAPELLRQKKFSVGLVSLTILLAVIILLILRHRRLQVTAERTSRRIACTVDPLTGLYNKPGFEKYAQDALAKAPPEKVCALVSFEIVSFRSYNTLYGFDAGDELLRTVALIIRSHMCDADVSSRLYADHFAWLLCRDTEEEVYESLREAVRSAKSSKLPFFLCGGIYLIEDRSMRIAAMTDFASIAKDTIKYKFTTGIAIYNDSMLECQREDAKLVGSMMSGLENGEFIEYYQPKFSLNSEGITSAEALVRWKKPDGEIIMPGRFIELFEKNGYIRKLDYYMFERVCSMLSDAQENGTPKVPIAVNFSRVHLYDAHFPDRIAALAKKYCVDTKYLIVELTESAFILEGKALIEVVDRLHNYGFSVAIDDFGSGFSSLNMLKDVNVDELKIDMKFLEGFERGGKVGTVVTSVIRMAKWLGIPAVAEGVETREQIEFLRTLGCDMIQGYYYSRPVPRDEYEKKLLNKEIAEPVNKAAAAVTVENINSILGADSLVTALIDGILGGFGLYALSANRLEAIRINRAYLEILGYPDMGAFSAHSLNVLTQVYPADVEPLLTAANEAVRTGTVQRLELRRYNYAGELGYYRYFIKSVGGTPEEPLICISFIDATERLRAEREKELKKYSEALYGIFDDIYEFNYSTNVFRILSIDKNGCDSAPDKLDKREQNWLGNIIFPPDRARIEALVVDARAEKAQYPSTIEYRVRKNKEIRWIMSTIVSVSGGSFLMCNLDITRRKQFDLLVKQMGSVSSEMLPDAEENTERPPFGQEQSLAEKNDDKGKK